MTGYTSAEADMVRELLDASHELSIEQLPTVVRECALRAGLRETLIYVVDVQEVTLHLLTGRGRTAGEGYHQAAPELSVRATTAGRAFQYGAELPDPERRDGAEWWWMPLLNGAERLGVIGIAATRIDGPSRILMRELASMVSLLIASRGEVSDSYQRLVRYRPMTIAAELQRSLTPPYTFANKAVTISAVFEPAYDIAGDAFDYALAGDIVHLAVFDAMGHNISAGLTANLAVAACRNARREGTALADLGGAIEAALTSQFGHEQFATGVIAELNTSSGEMEWISHGHLPPILIRDNANIELGFSPGHPLGTELDIAAELHHVQLEPGDLVVLYTDGVTEARTQRDDPGTAFGLERLLEFIISHDAAELPAPEMLRRLMNNIPNHDNHNTQDDATIVVLEWRGNPNRELAAHFGRLAGRRNR